MKVRKGRAVSRPARTTFAVAVILGIASGSHAFASSQEGVVATSPSPSPDGDEVVFDANYDGPIDLWIASIDGQSLRKLTNNPDVDEEAAWSPDGSTIAFTSRKDQVSDIWSIQPDGSRLSQLTQSSLNNKQAAWSPNSRRIAFVSDRGGSNDIWIMNADGTSPMRVTSIPGDEDHPSFSPSGDEIVFGETIGDSSTLMVVNADGTGLRPLTTGTAKDWNPSWSSSGILFSSNRGSDHWKIWKVQPDGSGLAPVGDQLGLDPVQAPDGRILFSDETGDSKSLAAITLLDPTSGKKQVVSSVQGFLIGIDIRPDSEQNRVSPQSRGLLPVAVLSSADFDAVALVDQATLSFGRLGDEESLASCKKNGIDVNQDKRLDLVCLFAVEKAGFKAGDKLGILRFRNRDGTPFEGRDRIVPSPSENARVDPFGEPIGAPSQQP